MASCLLASIGDLAPVRQGEVAAVRAAESLDALVERLTRVRLGATTMWHWVQAAGGRAQARLAAELAADGPVTREQMTAVVDKLLMLIGADGVMVPFRPNGGSPAGRSVWREVKVGVIARLGERVNRHGHKVTVLCQRRLVAVLGDVDAQAARLKIEALRQGLASGTRAVWISDGARGLWRVYREQFAPLGVVGVLDFFHTVGQIWEAAEAWFWRYLSSAHQWLGQARHQLRHGQVADVIQAIRTAAAEGHRTLAHRAILERVARYLDRHRLHLGSPSLGWP